MNRFLKLSTPLDNPLKTETLDFNHWQYKPAHVVTRKTFSTPLRENEY